MPDCHGKYVEKPGSADPHGGGALADRTAGR
jgi:hypothetical protein